MSSPKDLPEVFSKVQETQAYLTLLERYLDGASDEGEYNEQVIKQLSNLAQESLDSVKEYAKADTVKEPVEFSEFSPIDLSGGVSVKGTKYRHYLGRIYWLLDEGIHTETNEKLTIYTNGTKLFARPSDMFHGRVTQPGHIHSVKRFVRVENE